MRISKHKIISRRIISNDTYILRIEKNNLSFIPGQFVLLGYENFHNSREYSFYSPNNVSYIEFFIKKVANGYMSNVLAELQIGTELLINGPYGDFLLQENGNRHIFLAIGTGIAPFHSMIFSYSNLDYLLLHGVKKFNDIPNVELTENSKYIVCCSSDNFGYKGRITDFLNDNKVILQDDNLYVCGKREMLEDVSKSFNNKSILYECFS